MADVDLDIPVAKATFEELRAALVAAGFTTLGDFRQVAQVMLLKRAKSDLEARLQQIELERQKVQTDLNQQAAGINEEIAALLKQLEALQSLL